MIIAIIYWYSIRLNYYLKYSFDNYGIMFLYFNFCKKLMFTS